MNIITGSKEELDAKAVDIISDYVSSHEQTVIALPGGRSIQGLFTKLVNASLDWSKIHLFFVDERFVPTDHEDSNAKQAKELLVAKIKIPEQNVHYFPSNSENLDESVTQYNKELASVGGLFDIVVLGAGEDGHVASLFPGHDTLNDDSIQFIVEKESPKPPPVRVSASPTLISQAKVGILYVLGEGKQDAFTSLQDTNKTIQDCPAKLIENTEKHYVLTDLQ